MITISNLSKQYAKRTILNNVSFSIFKNEHIGLTGPNGAGKTTLFSLILKDAEPDSGQIQVQRDLNIGYLPQEARFLSERTVMEEMTSGDSRIASLLEEKHKLEDENKAGSNRYGDVLHRLEQLGIYELEHKAEKILSGLGFKAEDFHKPINNLSGGWQMRTLLAKMLTYSYDIILLDEPTNYLDMDATLWFKDFLASYKGTFVVVSHDKVFLNDVTNYTIVLDNAQMIKIKGNYEFYENQKSVDFKTLEKKKKVVDKKRRQLEKFTQRFHAQPNRASAVRNKKKMIQKLENIELPQDRKSIKDFEFPPTKRSGETVISLSQASKAYGPKIIYENLDFEISRGQKICLVGPNGAGKSTLLKMLADVLKPDSGTRKLGYKVDMGYFSQTRLDVLNPSNTAFDEVYSAIPGSIPAEQIRTLLGLFNFHGEDVFKQVRVLSGGEKSRLILAKLLINPPNFMLLDEPTTHLDIAGVEALTKAIRQYEGTLCFISHDLFFVKEVANSIIEVDSGKLKVYPGGLDYYLDKKEGILVEEKKVKQAEKKQAVKAKEKIKGKKKAMSARELELHTKHKEAKKRIKEIKAEMAALEKEAKDLETESYIKSRVLSKSFNRRTKEQLSEIGMRLKEIQKRQREIASTIKTLKEEKKKIEK